MKELRDKPLRRRFGPDLSEIQSAVEWVLSYAPDWTDRQLLDLGLTEALTNALVHGNLGVSSELRAPSLENYLNAVERGSTSPAAREHDLCVELTLEPTRFRILVRWTGTPCPPEKRGARAARAGESLDPMAGSGLGQSIIESSFDEVHWGADGLSQTLSALKKT